MKITEKEMITVQECFPDLYLDETREKICGELSFHAYYDKKKVYLNPSRTEKEKNFHGYYEIEIIINEKNVYGLPPVYETSGKILEFAQKHNISLYDLHLNGDGSCCLGIFTPGEAFNMTLYIFIIEVVFSFFAWQSYVSTFNKKAPWGEYSHTRGFTEKNIDIWVGMNNAGRNKPCPCGSGIKFKRCCLDKFQLYKRGMR